jgi:hypothetical protein
VTPHRTLRIGRWLEKSRLSDVAHPSRRLAAPECLSVGDLPEILQCAPKVRHPLGAKPGLPLRLDTALLNQRDRDRVPASGGDPDQAGSPVRRVRDTLHVSADLEVTNQEGRRLFAHLSRLRQIGKTGSVAVQALEETSLRWGDVVAACGHRGQYPLLHVAVGDEEKHPHTDRSVLGLDDGQRESFLPDPSTRRIIVKDFDYLGGIDG